MCGPRGTDISAHLGHPAAGHEHVLLLVEACPKEDQEGSRESGAENADSKNHKGPGDDVSCRMGRSEGDNTSRGS